MAVVRILGIDPGTRVVGYACVECEAGEARAQSPKRAAGSVESRDAIRGGDAGIAELLRASGVSDDSSARGRGRPIALRASNVVRVGRPGPTRVLEAAALKLGAKSPVADRLAALQTALEGWLEQFRPDEVAVEEAFCGRSVQSALRIGEARGVVLAQARRFGASVHEYPPARIKRSVTGSGRADKERVATMACAAVGLEGIEGPADAADALAVALCRVEERRSGLFDQP